MIVSIILNEEERVVAEIFAKRNGQSISELMKQVFFEKIEDKYDSLIIENEVKDSDNNQKTYSLDEIKKELEL